MNQNEIERRVWTPKFEVREAEGGKRTIVGLVVPYEHLSEDMGGWFERFKRGAFSESLTRGDEIVALVGHDMAKILGRRSAETARFTDSDAGVTAEIDLPDTSYANDALASIKRGDLKGMSVGFYQAETEWLDTPDGMIRIVTRATIFDASVVAWPAYPDTSVAVRSRPVKPEPKAVNVDHRDRSRNALARLRAPGYASTSP